MESEEREGNDIFVDCEVREAVLRPILEYSDFALVEADVLNHLREPPMFTIVRVNTMISDRSALKEHLTRSLLTQYEIKNCPKPLIEKHPDLPDVLVIRSHRNNNQIIPQYPKVIVGLKCAEAVIRGAHVYAPGVLGVSVGLSRNDKVSVYADLMSQCKRGWMQEFDGKITFVGNGILVQTRREIFAAEQAKGIAIKMTEVTFDCPSIGDVLLDSEKGLYKGFLQNLPSILCGHVLNPSENHYVLDMCAAPGGKTTHLATLMKNKGGVIALDKSATKIQQIVENCRKLGLTNVTAFAFDSTKSVRDSSGSDDNSNVDERPPFGAETFDRILLDAPCSALGQRPQLYNPIRFKELQSFSRLQKKLFHAAFHLLKIGGRMVYSTCTYNVMENEEIVRWALESFPNLELVPSLPLLGRPAFQVHGLSDDQCRAMQRFGPSNRDDPNSDTIGFFLCSFEKKSL